MNSAKPHRQLLVVNALIEYEGKLLILRRVDKEPMWHHKWEFPGGKIQAGESILDGLYREAQEETGLQINHPELLGIYTHHWDHSEFIQQTFVVCYRCQTDNPTGVRLNERENDLHRWVTLEEFMLMDDHLDGNYEIIASLYQPHRQTSAIS